MTWTLLHTDPLIPRATRENAETGQIGMTYPFFDLDLRTVCEAVHEAVRENEKAGQFLMTWPSLSVSDLRVVREAVH